MSVPILETKRLVLRAFTLADAPRVKELAGAFQVADTTGQIPHPYLDGMAEEWIESHTRQFQDSRAATFAITVRADGVLVGAIGMGLSPENHRAELGYWIGVPYWNCGYCTEAARAVLGYGFGTLGLNRVYAYHFARNPASGRVMEKVGMKYEGTQRQHFVRWTAPEDLVFYGILKSEWEFSNRGVAHPQVVSFLSRDLFQNVVMLKTLSQNPESAQAYYCERDSEIGVLVLRPTRDSLFDQRGYPQTEYIVLASATHSRTLAPLLPYIPKEFNLVFKLTDPSVRAFLAHTFPLKRVTAYISYTTIGKELTAAEPDVIVSDRVSEECLDLFEAQGHPRVQVQEYFSVREALCLALYRDNMPVSACFTFQNFEQIHEIGGVYTRPEERGKGFGQRIVATALYELARRGRIPRYVVQEDNRASMALAERVGLRPLVTMEHWLYTAG